MTRCPGSMFPSIQAKANRMSCHGINSTTLIRVDDMNNAFFLIMDFSRLCYVLSNVIFSLSVVQAMEIFLIT